MSLTVGSALAIGALLTIGVAGALIYADYHGWARRIGVALDDMSAIKSPHPIDQLRYSAGFLATFAMVILATWALPVPALRQTPVTVALSVVAYALAVRGLRPLLRWP